MSTCGIMVMRKKTHYCNHNKEENNFSTLPPKCRCT